MRVKTSFENVQEKPELIFLTATHEYVPCIIEKILAVGAFGFHFGSTILREPPAVISCLRVIENVTEFIAPTISDEGVTEAAIVV